MYSKKSANPFSAFLRIEQLPTIWCPGCGVGITVNAFLQAVEKSACDHEDLKIISSELGCTGKIAHYLRCPWKAAQPGELFQTALEEKLKYPDSHIFLFIQDGDFLVSGVNELLKISQKGESLIVVFINSYIYNLLIYDKKTRPLPFQKHLAPQETESPYNMPLLMERNGASLIARWTPLHVRRLSNTIRDAVSKQGLSFIEVLSPCLMYIASEGKLGWKIDRMGAFYTDSEIRNDAPLDNLDTRIQDKIIVGKFIDR